MNKILGALIVFLSACLTAEATPPPPPSGAVAQVPMVTARYEVRGMACQSCASRLEVGIRKLVGVTKADVDFSTKILTVKFYGSKTAASHIKAEIQRHGFEAKPINSEPS